MAQSKTPQNSCDTVPLTFFDCSASLKNYHFQNQQELKFFKKLNSIFLYVYHDLFWEKELGRFLIDVLNKISKCTFLPPYDCALNLESNRLHKINFRFNL